MQVKSEVLEGFDIQEKKILELTSLLQSYKNVVEAAGINSLHFLKFFVHIACRGFVLMCREGLSFLILDWTIVDLMKHMDLRFYSYFVNIDRWKTTRVGVSLIAGESIAFPLDGNSRVFN